MTRRIGTALAHPSRRFAFLALAALTTASSPRVAFAQTPAAPAAAPAASGAAAAKGYLSAGDRAAKAKDWQTALAQYTAANAAAPSSQALQGIANAQYQLKHQGEAYDAYDQLLKSYPNAIGTTAKKTAETRMKELAATTGYLSIRVNEGGAAVSIDGSSIGNSPVAALIRVTAGAHKVDVTKEGFTPIEQTPNVPAGGKQIVEIALVREATTGHLVVREKSNQAVRVLVDGNDLGAAPLEVDLPPGSHEVIARNSTMASPPQRVDLAKGKTTEVNLAAVAAAAHLEITTSDRQGIVFLDGKPVAEGAYAGDVAIGPHKLAVTRDGFERWEKTIDLADKQTVVETVTLKRPQAEAPKEALQAERSYDGLYGGLGLTGFFLPGGSGNEIDTDCSRLGAASCSTSTPIGGGLFGYMGYSWHPVGIELFLAGEYDQSTPSATFDGVVKPGQNPLAAGLPRVEQFAFLRGGGVAALRARISFQTSAIRGSFAAGFGASYKLMFMGRDSKTSDGLENIYSDKSAHTYLSPALSLEGSVGFRLSQTFTLQLGLMSLLETAGADLKSNASSNEYIGSVSAQTAVPIATPQYHLATSTQFYLGPFVGVMFGP